MRWLISVMFVVGLLATPLLLEAQAPEASEADRARARTLFQEGVAHLDASEWEAARAKFQEAYDLVHEPSILLNLAHAQVESGRLLEGAASYRQFLDEVRTGRLARNRRDAQNALNAVEARIPKLRINAPTLQEGDEITLDGAPFDRTRLGTDVQVAPGEHLVLVTRGDETYANESFTLAERERRTLDLGLTAPVAAPTPEQVARTQVRRNGPLTPDAQRRRRIAIGVGVGAGVPVVLATLAAIIIVVRN